MADATHATRIQMKPCRGFVVARVAQISNRLKAENALICAQLSLKEFRSGAILFR
jgi:hypothetical protein